jgi:GNAT superfamily N-acetyltransferase
LNFNCQWRGEFESAEVGLLHADAFGSPADTEAEAEADAGAADAADAAERQTDWRSTVAAHSLGWVTARDEGARLIGFANVIWDGGAHAWIQDVMVSSSSRNNGLGTRLVTAAREAATQAGCQWLHVDFEESLRPFYLDACGFAPATAGLIRLESS